MHAEISIIKPRQSTYKNQKNLCIYYNMRKYTHEYFSIYIFICKYMYIWMLNILFHFHHFYFKSYIKRCNLMSLIRK